MNIPPKNNPSISNDPLLPPNDPTNVPIKTIPDDAMKHIVSYLNNKAMQEVATTAKPLTNITVDQAKQNSASEIQKFTSDFNLLFDKLTENLVAKNEIEEAKKIRQEILAFQGTEVLGSVNLKDVKSSTMEAKIDLAKILNKFFKINSGIPFPQSLGTSDTARDILKLVDCYIFIDKNLETFQDELYMPKDVVLSLIELGDLPKAFEVVGLISNAHNPHGFELVNSVELSEAFKDKKIPESTLDQMDKIVDKSPENQFKMKALLLLSSKRFENGNLDKALKDVNKVNDSWKEKAQLLKNISAKYSSEGNLEEVEKINKSLAKIEEMRKTY